MSFNIIFHPAAHAEMCEAAKFYEETSPGLGVDFLDEVEHNLKQIEANPKIAPFLKGDVRRKVLRKFPYSILYTVGKDQIRILAIMHHKRRPFYWRKRI